MRTFIALNFQRGLVNRLGNIQKTLKDNSVKGRWVYIDNFHITLKFLGTIDPMSIDNIKDLLEKIAKKNYQMEFSLEEMGFFPGKDILRVVFLNIDGDVNNLQSLQNQVDKSMKTLGFPKEKRNFKPHITIARDVVFNSTIYQINELIKDDLRYNFTLDTISFMKSEEVGSKRIYTSLGDYKLKVKGL